MPYKNKNIQTYTQADGVVEVSTANQNVLGHQVTIGGDSTSGTLAFEVKYHQDGQFETLYEADDTTAKVIDLSDPRTFTAEGCINAFRITPTTVDASYKVLILSGVNE